MEEENKHRNLKAIEGGGGRPEPVPEDDAAGEERGRSTHEPRRSIGQRLREGRGIYLLPNLITTGALFAGFFAIVQAMNGQFVNAALAIYAAMLLDAADGRVARFTRSTSAFGAEYDSLSDMVAFGVAPALVAFSFALSELGQLGWVVTFIYMACAALRLARFNSQPEQDSFTGLASPAAAALVACAVWVLVDLGYAADLALWGTLLMATVTTAAGLLMVYNVRYFSPKALPLKGRVPFITMVIVVLVFAVILADPPKVLLSLAVLYALSGPAHHLWRLRFSHASSGSNE